jgi:hypothetical protein
MQRPIKFLDSANRIQSRIIPERKPVVVEAGRDSSQPLCGVWLKKGRWNAFFG